jgi:hypothetical protein
MPQPVDPKRRHHPRRFALSRPECAVLIATAVLEWAHVERALSTMFSVAITPQTVDATGQVSTSRLWTAVAVMSEMDSLHMRIKIIKRTLVSLLPDDLSNQWDGLEKQLRARAKERNTLAHGLWSFADEYPADLLLEEEDGRVLRYTKKDFEDVVTRICDLNSEVYAFLLRIQEHMRSGKFCPPKL